MRIEEILWSDHARSILRQAHVIAVLESGSDNPIVSSSHLVKAVDNSKGRGAPRARTAPINAINGHILLVPGHCGFINHHRDGRHCPVCDGGLAVCANCGEYEAGLDGPCRGPREAQR